MSNTPDNKYVGAAKPRNGGIYWAPKGTTLPTDASTALSNTFKCLGYISTDGVTNSNAPTTTDVQAWGFGSILTLASSKADTFKFKMMEVLNAEVQKVANGSDQVTGNIDADTGMTVKHKNAEPEEAVFVIDMIMNGILVRQVVPKGMLSALSDITYKDSDTTGYEATISAAPGGFTDDAEVTSVTYYKKKTA